MTNSPKLIEKGLLFGKDCGSDCGSDNPGIVDCVGKFNGSTVLSPTAPSTTASGNDVDEGGNVNGVLKLGVAVEVGVDLGGKTDETILLLETKALGSVPNGLLLGAELLENAGGVPKPPVLLFLGAKPSPKTDGLPTNAPLLEAERLPKGTKTKPPVPGA